jgi:hypothetical protein
MAIDVSVPSRDVTNRRPRIIKLLAARVSLVSDITVGDGKNDNLS